MWIDDNILKRCKENQALDIWVPEEIFVVLGSSNKAETECQLEPCNQSGIKILKRYGGGGAVVLHPGCVILSLGLWVGHLYKNDYYFRWINQSLIQALQEKWPEFSGLSQNGISDITIGEKKIAGTSLFRSRNYLLYQASIMTDPRPELMEAYLAHPSKEPDYRQGKAHREFVAGLNQWKSGLKSSDVASYLSSNFLDFLVPDTQTALIDSQADQWNHILKRTLTKTL